MSLEVAQRNFDTNMKKLAWTPTLKNQYDSIHFRAKNSFDNNINESKQLVEQIVKGVRSAAARRDRSRVTVTQAIGQMNNMNGTLGRMIAETDIGGIQNKIRIVEDALKEERKTAKSSKVLLGIRKEQAAALEKKYSSNLHSSYLGLWRPLKDDSHTGLNVASVMMGLVTSAMVCYLVYQYWFVMAGGGVRSFANVGANVAANVKRNIASGYQNAKAVFGSAVDAATGQNNV